MSLSSDRAKLRIFISILQLASMFHNVVIANSRVYHIVVTPNDLCPSEHCATLSQFATNVDSYLGPNTTLLLQPGHHLLNAPLNISSVEYFSTTSVSNSLHVSITCKQLGSFKFQNTTEIVVNNLEFLGCGGNNVSNVSQFVV